MSAAAAAAWGWRPITEYRELHSLNTLPKAPSTKSNNTYRAARDMMMLLGKDVADKSKWFITEI